MIVCPVCEHAQAQGAECEVCGKRLAPPSRADPVQPPVEGLEPTGHAAVQAPPAILPELEPTRHAPAAPADDRTPDIEPTRAPPVDVEVAPAADLERTAAEIPGDAATPLPAVVTCRYCRTPAAPGERLCARCGMRLPGVRTEPPAPAGEAGWRCTCGTLVRGSLCPSCGARPPAH